MEWSDSATLLSQKLPIIRRRLRMSQGQVKTYHDRQILEYLAQASVEMTLSSKIMLEKRLELDYTVGLNLFQIKYPVSRLTL